MSASIIKRLILQGPYTGIGTRSPDYYKVKKATNTLRPAPGTSIDENEAEVYCSSPDWVVDILPK
jgi:hypothetical protein